MAKHQRELPPGKLSNHGQTPEENASRYSVQGQNLRELPLGIP